MNKYTAKITKMQAKDLPEWVEWKYMKFVNQADRIIDVTLISKKPAVYIKNLKGREYLNLKTGEVRAMQEKKAGEHYRNKRSLRKIFRDLRQLINTNFTGEENEQFLTLTYKDNMQNKEKLYKDFELFWKTLKYRYKDENLQYIAITEPQGRGAWHIHLLVKAISKLTFYPEYKEIQKLWPHGNLKGEALKSVNNIGSYFIAYFTNIEITEKNRGIYELSDSDIAEKNGKKVIKGERLDMYPDWMKIYRTTKGIIKPKITDYAKMQNFNQTYESLIQIKGENGGEMYIKSEQHKKKK